MLNDEDEVEDDDEDGDEDDDEDDEDDDEDDDDDNSADVEAPGRVGVAATKADAATAGMDDVLPLVLRLLASRERFRPLRATDGEATMTVFSACEVARKGPASMA